MADVHPFAPTIPSAKAGSLAPWIQLAKPGITRMVVLTTLFGGVMADASASWSTWGLTVVGTALVVASANALNMVAERDSDALMARTRLRPLPQGQLTVAAARLASLAAAMLGLGALIAVNLQAALVALLALVAYVWVYTPLKQVTPLALYVGTLPGAAPPVIGYVAISGGRLDVFAGVLFLLMAVWQIPHFLAISIFRREEYRRAGIRVFSVCWRQRAVRWFLLAWTIALFLVTMIPGFVGMGGTLYWAVAIGFGLPCVAGAAYGLTASADDRWARSFFFASMPHLVVLLLALTL